MMMKRSCGNNNNNNSCISGNNNHNHNNNNKVERKTIEKNRRMHMKSLSLKLLSLIPKDHLTTSKDAMTQLDHLGEAASYVKKLRGRIEKLKQRRESSGSSIDGVRKDTSEGTTTTTTIGVRLPVVEVRCQDTNLEVVLISSSSSSGGDERRFRFHEVISVLEEEGAEVVNANFSVVGDKVFHTIHSQVVCSRIELQASRVSERLKDLVC